MRLRYTTIVLMLMLPFFLRVPAAAPPDEGMWLPLLIKTLNYQDMKALGCSITAEEIYSVNNSSVKDAIVQLGSFCTAEVVSKEGLLFTNHHCAYDAIQTHSSVENDYLTDGFWAKSKEEELNTPGLTASFLVRMEDVTKRIIKKAQAADEDEREVAIAEEMTAIEEEAGEGNDYRVEIEEMFNGNQYFLFVYEEFLDVRLVGAPPSSVGKFGGDTDNWMWPRHTGDFAVLRVYASPDNKPAEYSEENIPYVPKHHLPLSIKGVQEGDFAMIMGYPGSTERYLTSHGVESAMNFKNPDFINILDKRLKIMKAGMDADAKTRIQLASDYASLANTYKYFKGQSLGLRKRGLVEEKAAAEAEFEKWVAADEKRKAEYGGILEELKTTLEESQGLQRLSNYLNLAGFGPGLVTYGINFFRLKRMMDASPDSPESWAPGIERIKDGLADHFKDYSAPVDKAVFAEMVRMLYTDLPKELHPDIFQSKEFLKAKAKGDMDRFDAYAEYVFKMSMIPNQERVKAFAEKPSAKLLDKDPGMKYVNSIINLFITKVQAGAGSLNAVEADVMKKYQKGLMEMHPEKSFYPDANFTMRLTYGTVKPYDPRDAVVFNYYTTAEGILEKENPDDDEFFIQQDLIDLLKTRDYGRYARKDGKLPVCFLTNHDITGGNSGSPVINGDGHLIGIAFDGNWESMTSDLVYDEDIVRTINVDVRYVLFIIDKYAGAQNLIKELDIRN